MIKRKTIYIAGLLMACGMSVATNTTAQAEKTQLAKEIMYAQWLDADGQVDFIKEKFKTLTTDTKKWNFVCTFFNRPDLNVKDGIIGNTELRGPLSSALNFFKSAAASAQLSDPTWGCTENAARIGFIKAKFQNLTYKSPKSEFNSLYSVICEIFKP